MKNSSDAIGNRTHDLPACSTVPQPCHRVPLNRNYTASNFAYRFVGLQWDRVVLPDRYISQQLVAWF